MGGTQLAMSNTVFPASIDPPAYDPQTTDTLGSASHHTLHGFANDALIAIETKLGSGASLQSPTNNSILFGNGSGTSEWATTLTAFSFTTSLNDANDLIWIGQTAPANAVNYINIANAATTNAPVISVKGTDTNIDLNLVPKGSGKVRDNGTALIDFRTSFFNFIQSGCIWTAGVGLAGSMSGGVIFINGVEYTIPAIASHTFGASVDTYVDYTVGTGVTFNSVSNNAASYALAANSVRIGIIVGGSSAISSINQGATTVTAPVASGVVYSVVDSLGNLIYPSDPVMRTLGYRQVQSAQTVNSTSITAVTGLTLPVIVPTGRKIKLSALLHGTSGGGTGIMKGSIDQSSTVLVSFQDWIGATTGAFSVQPEIEISPSAGLNTYQAYISLPSTTSQAYSDAAGFTAFILAELA